MKYASTIERLTLKQVAILPRSLTAILATAKDMVAGVLDDLFDDMGEVYEEQGTVAIVNIQGVILPSCSKFERLCGAIGLKDVRAAIKQASTSNCTHVILKINSPGGSVQGVEATGKMIRELAKVKPVTAYVDELCASAGYWLAAQAGEILADESAEVGSIGVYLAFLTYGRMLDQNGVNAEVIQAGLRKTLGIPYKDITDEEKVYLQAGVDKTYAAFKAAVAHRELADSTMQGECYDAVEALDLKLIDGIQNDFDALIKALQ